MRPFTENLNRVIINRDIFDACSEVIRGPAVQSFDQALDAQKKGKFQQAEDLYRKIITRDPNNFDALHMLGIVCSENGKVSDAEKFFLAALSIDPKFPPCFHNYGLFLAKQKRYQDSIQQFDEALKLSSNFAPAYCDRGISLMEVDRLDESLASHNAAAALAPGVAAVFYNRGNTFLKKKDYGSALQDYDKAISLRSNYVEAHCGRGNVYSALDRHEEAVASYGTAIRLNPGWVPAWLGRGNAFRELKRYEEALVGFEKALTLQADSADAWLGRGNALAELERHDEALAAFDKALQLRPELASARLGQGNVLMELKRYEEAFTAFDAALMLDPNFAAAWLGRGNTLGKLRRYDEAFAAYDKALTAKPDFAEPWYGRGFLFAELKRYDEALAAYDRSIILKPDFPAAFFNKALVKLCLEDFHEGWDLYEWRAETKDHIRARPHLEALKCLVRQDRSALTGKNVLVVAEQGVGDEIMFSSILPDLIKDAKSVAYQVDDRLVSVFEHSFPMVNVISRKDAVPLQTYDVVLQAASLGYIYRRDRASFPKVPYLKPDPDRIWRWKERLAKEAATAKKIGISWRGGTEGSRRSDRSIALEQLTPLLQQEGCYFVSLQYGDVHDEILRFNAVNPKHLLYCPLNDFNDFDEFAALISALDLVISVQNTTIHMCGSLNRACWGMIPWTPEWRYGAYNDEMVWYRSVKLYRQNTSGKWDSVLNSIMTDIAAFREGID